MFKEIWNNIHNWWEFDVMGYKGDMEDEEWVARAQAYYKKKAYLPNPVPLWIMRVLCFITLVIAAMVIKSI